MRYNQYNFIEDEIRKENLSRGVKDNLPTFMIRHQIESAESDRNGSKEIADIETAILQMETTAENYAFRNIYSCRKYIGGVIVFCKRVLRKLLKWYLEPVCFQQTDFNIAAVGAVRNLKHLQEEQAEQLRQLNDKHNQNICQIKEEQTDEFQHQWEQLVQWMQEEQALLFQRQEEQIVGRLREEQAILLQHREEQALEWVAKEKEVLQQQKARSEQLEGQAAAMQTQIGLIEKRSNHLEERLLKLDQIFDRLRESGMDIPHGIDYYSLTNSQTGEDAILRYLLGELNISAKDCSYIDLGANHAKQMSNTYGFYLQGARGVLVEANPALIPELRLYRSEDIILNYCVADRSGDMRDFYVCNGDGVSTANRMVIEDCIKKNNNLSIIRELQVETISYNDIVIQYLNGQSPLLLDIDIEGYEMSVLQSIDYERFRPTIIVVETIFFRTSIYSDEKRVDIVNFLREKGYREYAFTGINSILIDCRLNSERNQTEGVNR